MASAGPTDLHRAKTGARAALHFKGKPLDLSALIKGTAAERLPTKLPVQLDLRAKGQGEAYATHAWPTPLGSSATVLYMEVPQETPPGTYSGNLELEGREIPVIADVEPEVELAAYPDELRFEGRPSDRIDAEITLVNAGNTAFEVRSAHAFGIFALHGEERALHAAYSRDLPEGAKRIDVLGDSLAHQHGGIVRVKVTSGSGSLAPGETRDLGLVFSLSDRVRPHHVYWGALVLGDLNYVVRFEITAEGPTDPTEPTRETPRQHQAKGETGE